MREDIRAEQSDANADNPDHGARIARTLESLVRHHEAKADDDSRQSDRDLVWVRRGFWIVFAYTLVTVLLALIGHNANLLNAVSNRAWIDVAADEATVSVKWDGEKRADFAFAANAKNKGNSPASYVFFSAKVFIDEGGVIKDPARLVLDACGRDVISLGQLIFPGSEVSEKRGAWLDANQIAMGKEFYSKANSLPTSKITAMRVTLLVCASYTITGDAKSHRTGRLYVITAPNGSWELPIGQDFSAGQMHLEEEHIKEYGD